VAGLHGAALRCAAPAPKSGCRFRPGRFEDSPALSTGTGTEASLSSPINRTLRTPSRCPPTRHHQHQLHSSSLLSSPPVLSRLSAHLCLVGAARPRRHTHFVTDLSLFRSANVTRPTRILQASRVVAHTSYLRSFKPFHTTSAPPAAPKPSGQHPSSQQPAAKQQPRPLQRPAPSTRFNSGLALVPRLDPSDSLPHTLTSSAALFLTPPPRPHTTPCLSPSNHCTTATRFPTRNIPPSFVAPLHKPSAGSALEPRLPSFTSTT